MSSFHLLRVSELFSKHLIILMAVVASHVLIAGAFIGGLDARPLGGSARGRNMPIPVAPSGELIPMQRQRRLNGG
jgi:hypothetical protein